MQEPIGTQKEFFEISRSQMFFRLQNVVNRAQSGESERTRCLL